MFYEKEISIVLSSFRSALKLFDNSLNRDSPVHFRKRNQSPVTIFDYAIQSIICQKILESNHNEMILAEERIDYIENNRRLEFLDNVKAILFNIDFELIDFHPNLISDFSRFPYLNRYWIIDPIDGTKGFINNRQYCFAIALIDNLKLVLGALCCPNLKFSLRTGTKLEGCCIIAVAGQGIKIYPLNDFSKPFVIARERNSINIGVKGVNYCESFETSNINEQMHNQFARLLDLEIPGIKMDSQCKYVIVLNNRANIYFRYPTSINHREYVWDHLAGLLIVREGGGMITDFRGNELDFLKKHRLINNFGVLASKNLDHQYLVNKIKKVIN